MKINFSFLFIVSSSLILISCHPSDGYKKVSQASALESSSSSMPVDENKILCSSAKDLEACTALKDECSIVFEDSDDGKGVRPFSACIENPKNADIPDDPADEVSVEEYVDSKSKCGELDPKHLIKKDHDHAKVLICHNSKDSAHTIAVSCSAIKAHLSHQDGKDFLGACKE